MIADALVFLRNRLNEHFKSLSSATASGASEDKVAFLDGEQKSDSVSFKNDTVTILLYRVEREAAMNAGDPYSRSVNGLAPQRVKPDIGLNLYILFAAKFRDYGQGLNYLSQVIRFFQSNNSFDRQSFPELGGEIVEIALDLVSLTVQQQNELWGLFRTSYVPSIAYRIRTVIFMDDAVRPSGDVASRIERRGVR